MQTIIRSNVTQKIATKFVKTRRVFAYEARLYLSNISALTSLVTWRGDC